MPEDEGIVGRARPQKEVRRRELGDGGVKVRGWKLANTSKQIPAKFAADNGGNLRSLPCGRLASIKPR
jgi:hypothetical protein